MWLVDAFLSGAADISPRVYVFAVVVAVVLGFAARNPRSDEWQPSHVLEDV